MARRLAIGARREAALAEVFGQAVVEVDRAALFEAWRRAHRQAGIEPPRKAALRWERACRLYSSRRVDAGWIFADWRSPRGRVHVALIIDGGLRVQLRLRGSVCEAVVDLAY